MMNQKRVSVRESLYILSLLAILALFGTGLLGNMTAVQAQSAEKGNRDAKDCILFGSAPAEATAEADTTDAEGTPEAGMTGVEATAEADTTDAEGTPEAGMTDQQDGKDQVAAYVGSLKVDEAALKALPEAGRCNALKTMAKITVEVAQTAALKANVGSIIDIIELDAENGYLVYSVQLKDGRDVKVDAGNGNVLATQAPDTTEGASK